MPDYYDSNAEAFIASTLDVEMSDLYDRFLPLIPPGGRILDAGCGSGRDALAFQKLGFQVHAFDASPVPAERASELLGWEVEVARFEDFRCEQSFDGIWACASLLHVPLVELFEAIKNLTNCLKDDGRMYVSFKLGDGERLNGSRRFTDMNSLKFRELLKAAPGLVLEDEWTSRDVRPGRAEEQWFNAILKKAGDA